MRSLLSGGLRQGLAGGRPGGSSRIQVAVAGAVPCVVVAGVVGPGPGFGGPVVADREAGDLLGEVGRGGWEARCGGWGGGLWRFGKLVFFGVGWGRGANSPRRSRPRVSTENHSSA